jgi:GNAT superfamily N-acetyltransferase
MTQALEIIRIGPDSERELRALFEEIAADDARPWFQPHPFDRETAARIANYAQQDLYFAVRYDGRFVAYGMLRGWDEGFEVPSLGIYVCRAARGTGIAALLMRHLHTAARLRGSPAVRLRVHEDNARARALYESLGYVFSARERGLLVGTLSLREGHARLPERDA